MDVAFVIPSRTVEWLQMVHIALCCPWDAELARNGSW